MIMSKPSGQDFIFNEVQDEEENGSSKNTKQQQLYSNHNQNHMMLEQQQLASSQSPLTLPQTKIIIVHPQKSPSTQSQMDQLQIIQLPSNKKENQLIERKTNYNQNREEIIFPYEESEEFDEQPQSSIRKLYKAMRRQESQIKHFNEDQEMEAESETHQYEQQISDEEYTEQLKNKIQIRSKSLRQLILFSIPQTKLIKCLVKIANDSFFTLQTVFHFYLLQERQLLMTARKKRFRISSKYEIFGKQKGHIQKLAIAKSNFSRTEYKLSLLNRQEKKQESTEFTSSIIKMTKVTEESKQPVYVEDQKCYLSYESNFIGLSQQKILIIKPKKHIAKTDRFSDIKSTYQNCQYERIQKFSNRLAQRDHQGKLVMDFKESGISYSSKNMIVENQLGEACLVFGKKRDDIFLLEIMSPFNFLQGFFVAICNLDRKLFVR